MPIYPYVCDCGNKYEITLTVPEYDEYKPGKCKKCGGKMVRSFEGVKTSFFCGRVLGPEDWNYNKETGEIEDGHEKTLRKEREDIALDDI